MTLLCIGQSGQVATALAERASTRQVDLVCRGRPAVDLLDLASLERCATQVAPRLIINAAAYTAVDAAESDADAALALNRDGARNIAEVCHRREIPLIHLSTDYVFDGQLDRPYREDDPVSPINIYGESKLAGEIAVRHTLKQNIILRTSWVYSPFGKNFVKTMLRLAKTRGGASVVNDQIGRPTNALDIADTVLDIAQVLRKQAAAPIFGTYHYATRGDCSWADLAALVFEIYEQRTGCKIDLKRIPTSEYPTPAARPLNSRLDTHKLEQVFALMPKHWTVGVHNTVNRLIDEGI
ncbi:MAG: dTDP-4-dehydrorhamnose reductase [Pseudomonadota bacterium]